MNENVCENKVPALSTDESDTNHVGYIHQNPILKQVRKKVLIGP